MATNKKTAVFINDLINKRLDSEFEKTAGKGLDQISNISLSRGSSMQRSLSALDIEVKALMEKGKKITLDNTVLNQTLRNYQSLLISSQEIINANSGAVQASGQQIASTAVTAKVFPGITEDIFGQGKDPIKSTVIYQKVLQRNAVRWIIPTAGELTMAAAIDFVESEAWIAKMEAWGVGYAELTKKIILEGIEKGYNPNKIAALLREHAENIPAHSAENLMRTLQLTSYREGSLAMEKLNGKFLIKKIRIATLDNRTCLACIALHGTDLEIGERVDDHHRGRCTEYYVVPGGAKYPPYMQVDSPSGGRNLVPFQKGEDWFASLSPERQKLQASMLGTPAKWNAYNAGNPLSSFVTTYQDDVFGNMITENSVIGTFGDDAAKYYMVNKGVVE